MAIVRITPSLLEEIRRRLKGSASEVIDLLGTLEGNPKKGKEIGHIGGILIKEVKYGVYRFYCITDGHKIKALRTEELADLLIKFIRMSDKDTQEETIDEIKLVLRKIGTDGFA